LCAEVRLSNIGTCAWNPGLAWKEKILKTANPFVREGIEFIPVIPGGAVVQLATTTFTEAPHAYGTPFLTGGDCKFVELESERMEHE
jgi:hypothetical protein